MPTLSIRARLPKNTSLLIVTPKGNNIIPAKKAPRRSLFFKPNVFKCNINASKGIYKIFVCRNYQSGGKIRINIKNDAGTITHKENIEINRIPQQLVLSFFYDPANKLLGHVAK